MDGYQVTQPRSHPYAHLGTDPKVLATEFGCDSESNFAGGKNVGDWCIDHAVDGEEEDDVDRVPEGTNMTNVCPCKDKDLCQVQ